MSVEVAFKYCEENKLDEDKFVKSLKKSYKTYGRLTDKQEKCLIDKMNNHQRVKRLLNTIENDSEFILSLRQFFNTRGFLTPKQIAMLEKF